MRYCTCGAMCRGPRCSRCARVSKAPRGNANQRGYDYKWRQLSKRYKDDHPMCEMCLDKGYVTPAEDVHHKQTIADRPDLRLDMNNLQALCKACHQEHHSGERRAPQRQSMR